MAIEKLQALRSNVQRELVEGLMPFWQTKVLDYQNGGFIGRMDSRGQVDRRAVKGLILNTLLLWSYATLYQFSKDDSFMTLAQRAYDYLVDNFLDAEHGGAFWHLDFKGNFLDTKKRTYGQAFFIHALAEYYKIVRENQVLDLASHFFDMIEAYAYDPRHGGYVEAFERNWSEAEDLRLSAVDMNEKKSMNTHLHILEAYTNLLTVWQNKSVEQKLSDTLTIFLKKILNPGTHHMRLFFDEAWTPKSEKISFGHDIEASWLFLEAAKVLNDPEHLENVKDVSVKMASAVLAKGMDKDGGLFWAGDKNGVIDADKHWWPQAEAVVGFLNAYQLSGEDKFLKAAIKTWSFIEKHIIDKKNGEWHWRVSQDRKPYANDPKVSEWKSPYHNSRACIEIIKRIDDITNQNP